MMMNSRDRLSIFLKSWLSKYLNEILGDLINLSKEKIENQYIRALVYQLYEKNGVVKRKEVDDLIKLVVKEDRKKIWSMGIKIGRYHIYLPKMLKPKAVVLRISLWKLFNKINNRSEIPKFGLNFIKDPKLNERFFIALWI